MITRCVVRPLITLLDYKNNFIRTAPPGATALPGDSVVRSVAPPVLDSGFLGLLNFFRLSKRTQSPNEFAGFFFTRN